jgi:hypothetical protein
MFQSGTQMLTAKAQSHARSGPANPKTEAAPSTMATVIPASSHVGRESIQPIRFPSATAEKSSTQNLYLAFIASAFFRSL